MTDFILTHYLWIKSFHLISVIAWMAGMLYLPRLFVYHVAAPKGSELSETLKIMERRLLRYITNPAMVSSWLFGGAMLWANWDGLMAGQGWMHAKLLLVVFLSAVHGLFAGWRKDFERDDNVHSAKFYRIWNEVPTVIMIAVVIFVIVKPF